MKLRELVVAIKVKVEAKSAEKVDKIFGQIVKSAKAAAKSIDVATKSAGKLDKNLEHTAKSGKDASKGLDAFARSAKKAEAAADQAGRSAEKAAASIEKAGAKSKKASSGFDFSAAKELGGKGISGVKSAFGLGAAAAGTTVALGSMAAGVTMEYDALRAALRNAEGDQAKANKTFGELQNIHGDITKITAGYVDLRTRGVKPTADQLTGLSDVAAAANADFEDIAKAVAAATDGQFKSLQQFGVKAEKVGSQVRLSFRGVTRTVGASASEINAAVASFGKLEGVAGSMAVKASSLAGVWGDFQDSMSASVDSSMQSSGAIEELKLLMADLTGIGEDGAEVFGNFLVEAIKDLRAWIKALGRERIKEWMERAASTAQVLIRALEMLLAAVGLVTDGIQWVIDKAKAFGRAADEVGDLVTGFAGKLGLIPEANAAAEASFISASSAALAYGRDVEETAGLVSKLLKLSAQMRGDGEMSMPSEDPFKEAVKEAAERSRAGFGEEFAVDPEKQIRELGLVPQRKEDETIEEKVARMSAEHKSPGELLAERGKGRGFKDLGNAFQSIAMGQGAESTRLGLNQEAAKLQDSILERKTKAELTAREQAKKRGLDATQTDFLVEASRKRIDDRSTKAAETFTEEMRKTGDVEKARKKALKELEDKTTRSGGGKKGGEFFAIEKEIKAAAKKQAEKYAAEELERLVSSGLDPDDAIKKARAAGLERAKELEAKFRKAGKVLSDGGNDLLQALGLKGHGSILENRPAPQSLVIQTVVTMKAADSIPVTVTMPEGSTLEQTKETVGNEVGRAIDEAARKQLLAIFDDAWSLRWDELGKARGGGRVPKSSKRGAES
jgi:hypothetical protein